MGGSGWNSRWDGRCNRSYRARPWPFRPRPWGARNGAHGRTVDGSSPQSCLERRMRWSAACTSSGGERSVKPSAQPTLVRTQHLPPPAETAPWLRKRARGAVFVLVTSRIRVCHCASRCRGVHGRIADVVRAGCAVRDTVGFPRTATDGPGKRGLVPAQVRCRCHAPPDGRHRPGRAGAAAAEGRAVRQTVASAARGASGQLLYWRGCPSRTALTERDSPRPARRSRSEQNAESARLPAGPITGLMARRLSRYGSAAAAGYAPGGVPGRYRRQDCCVPVLGWLKQEEVAVAGGVSWQGCCARAVPVRRSRVRR